MQLVGDVPVSDGTDAGGLCVLLLCVPVQFSTGMEGGSRRANELSRSTSVPYTAVPLRASDLIKSQNKMQGNFRTVQVFAPGTLLPPRAPGF